MNGIFKVCFPGLESQGILGLVMENREKQKLLYILKHGSVYVNLE